MARLVIWLFEIDSSFHREVVDKLIVMGKEAVTRDI